MFENSVLNLTILLPIFGSAIIGIFGFLSPSFRKQEKLIGIFATLMVAVPFVIHLLVFLNYDGESVKYTLFDWMGAGDFSVAFSYELDQLSIIMALIVTGVGSLIHIYSIGYMHGDKGYYKFFMYLNLFIFSMSNLILSDNMLVMFLGWEGVGACSYLLIGFWYEDMEKAKAAQKAFVANRIGDFAMLAAIFIVFWQTGTLSYSEIIHTLDSSWAPWVSILIFLAATGKSAQIPLYVWLPDAMAGPTPVSALIHAATMVTSGIYLIARMSHIFLQAPYVMITVALVGAFTAITAALTAIAQNDIKKVLAYSTVSQLGYMFIALGAGAFTTAIFHVMTHAFFKACLFLGSGSVIHAMEHAHVAKDPQDIRTMGGLGKYMPSTSKTFWISSLAISGIPPLAGFFSKDEILGKTFAAGHESAVYYFVWIMGIVTAVLTAFYMTRVTYLTFNGKERFKQTDHKPHESNAFMTIPLWVLAVLAIVAGFFGLPEIIGHGDYNWISHSWLGEVIKNRQLHAEFMTEIILIAVSIILAVFGVYLAFNLYKNKGVESDNKVKSFFGAGAYKAFSNKFYVDEFYNIAFIRPFVWISDGLAKSFDIGFIDDILVDGTAKFIAAIANQFKKLQTGLVKNYALLMTAGIIAILTYLIFG